MVNAARSGLAFADSSGGWHQIRKIDADLWDFGYAEPALLAPGTVVCGMVSAAPSGPAAANSSAGWHPVGARDAGLWGLGRAKPALLTLGSVVCLVAVRSSTPKGAAW